MLGSAAARHASLLAPPGTRIVLVGPDEPSVDWSQHDGPFAAHYDEGRITRIVDTDVLWARLAQASIARYRELESATGVTFYNEVGFLLLTSGLGQPASYGARTVAAIEEINLPARTTDNPANNRYYEVLSEVDMAQRFPRLVVQPGAVGIYQQYWAGVISPRRLVACQKQLARQQNVDIISEEATSITEDAAANAAIITLKSGRKLTAGRVLVAVGAFADPALLDGAAVPYTLNARTVLLVDVTEQLQQDPAFAQSPSLIAASQGAKPFEYVYQLPPVLYPDGRYYVKIGTSEFPHATNSAQEIRDWFRSPPAEEDLHALRAELYKLYPHLRGCPETGANCAFTTTDSGRPVLTRIRPHIFLLGGCNGSAAKSSDEIGRLGACFVLDQWPEAEYRIEDFAPDEALRKYVGFPKCVSALK